MERLGASSREEAGSRDKPIVQSPSTSRAERLTVDLLRLQKAAGNGAVNALLSHARPASPSAQSSTVRVGGDPPRTTSNVDHSSEGGSVDSYPGPDRRPDERPDKTPAPDGAATSVQRQSYGEA